MLALIRCPSCGKVVMLNSETGECPRCRAGIEAEDPCPEARSRTETIFRNGRMRKGWLVLALIAVFLVWIAAFLVLRPGRTRDSEGTGRTGFLVECEGVSGL